MVNFLASFATAVGVDRGAQEVPRPRYALLSRSPIGVPVLIVEEILQPHPPEGLHRRNLLQPGECLFGVDGIQQFVPISAYLLGLSLARLLAVGQLLVVEPSDVPTYPLGLDALAKPPRGYRGEDIQSVAHGLPDQLQAVEATHRGENASGVGALLASLFHELHLTESLQQVVEKQLLGSAL